MRAIEHGTNLTNPVVLDYELTSRGTEPVWMPSDDAPMGYSLEDVPVYLRWEATATTPRPAGSGMDAEAEDRKG